ncbi:cytochrome c/FTR1 family iron permease [Owenweeksia hongkongensis]|uniref:cytochrome c/FTR1 family iron permease n=1 Tax=Owenweeksia hongkongensis TaxID=253245 RepID=UPI003A90DA51
MKYLSIWRLYLAAIVMMAGVGKASAQGEDARMMVHLLDYIAVDYGMAVQNGKVISQAEYTEMQEFAATVNDLGKKAPAELQSDIMLIKRLVDEKASQEKINSVASNLKQEVISLYNLEIAPKRWPELKSGKALFAVHCQSCHGEDGRGDGPLSAGLEPAPTNFHSPDKANGLSPFQAYNTIRLGVEGTGMRGFNELNDDEVWDLAFYALSLSQIGKETSVDAAQKVDAEIDLERLASSSNEELKLDLAIAPEHHEEVIAALRLYPKEVAEKSQGDYLQKAKRLLNLSVEAYKEGRRDEARNLALTAYLEGVEPVEAQLRANDASFSVGIENQLAKFRSAIEKDADASEVEAIGVASVEMINDAQVMLSEKEFSAWLAFLMSFSIILREGLEAFLVIVTILGIIRSLKLPNAAVWVHSGWVAAIVVGFLLWLAADRLFTFSGAQREVMEGAIAIFAVGVLLYVGFWMHSKSEAGKWQAYVKSKIQVLARKENMLGLAFLSFMVVFREAFESVLFLSALNMEVGEDHQFSFVMGIVVAFAILLVISVLLLRYSKKIPITQLFKYSAMIISFLAVVLIGKGVHSIQEAGIISISLMPIDLRWSLIGLYPTWETFLSQVFIVGLIIFLWNLGNKVMKKPICETEKEKIDAKKKSLEAEKV